MALPVNRPETIDKLVMTAFSNKTDLAKFLGPIVDFIGDKELKNKVDAHIEQEIELIREITESLQKKSGINYFAVLPTDKDAQQFYKTDHAVPLFAGNLDSQKVFGFADVPQQIDDSPEMINETIQKYCFRYFHIPKDYRLSDDEISMIFKDDFPSSTCDDVISMRVHTDEAAQELSKHIPSMDWDDAVSALDDFSMTSDFQAPFLNATYPVMVTFPLTIDRGREEAYIEGVDPIDLLNATNLSASELYSFTIQHTQQVPCLTFLTELPLSKMINMTDDMFDSEFIDITKGTRLGVFDVETNMHSDFNRVVAKNLKIPIDDLYFFDKGLDSSFRKSCHLSDDMFHVKDKKEKKKVAGIGR